MKHILLAATAWAVLAPAAFAQSTATSGSTATLTNTTGSRSSAVGVSNPQANVIGSPVGNGASSSVSQSSSQANTRSASSASATGNRSSFSGRQSLSLGNTRTSTSTTINYSIGSGTSGAGANGSNGTNAVDPAGANGANGANAAGTTASGDPAYSVNYSGGYSVHNVPEVIAPNIVGGNPCAVGASGGLAVSGFGITGGGTWADKQCERRQQAAQHGRAARCLRTDVPGRGRARRNAGGGQAVCWRCGSRGRDTGARGGCRASAAARRCRNRCFGPTPAPQPIAAAAPNKVKPEWCDRATPQSEASRHYVVQQCGELPHSVPVAATSEATLVATAPVLKPQQRPEWCWTAGPAELRRFPVCDVKS
jgi:hypothetical protein